MQVSGNPPRTPSAFTSHQSYCAAMDRELKKHFPLSLCPFCLIGESSVWCNGIHLNRNTSEVLFFFEFGFYLKRLGWRTWSVPNSQLSRGSVFPFPAFSSSKIAASPQLTVVKTGHLGNWCVSEDMLENHKLTVRPCGISLLTTWRKYWATGSFYTSHVYFSETFASFTYLSSLHCSLEKSVCSESLWSWWISKAEFSKWGKYVMAHFSLSAHCRSITTEWKMSYNLPVNPFLKRKPTLSDWCRTLHFKPQFIYYSLFFLHQISSLEIRHEYKMCIW